MTATVHVPLGDRAYDVIVGCGLLGDAAGFIRERMTASRYLVVYDEAVADTWTKRVEQSLATASLHFDSVSVPSGEKSKCASQLDRLWEFMAGRAYTRDTALIVVGGGVLGDLGGYLAASFLRGIPFVQVPTTLLAMVDSSVGGKTGINLAAGKNLVGAFWQPSLVVADIESLSTLPIEELRSGMAEVIKYGVIRDAELFGWLEQRPSELSREDLAHIVKRSVEIKAEVVANDERETTGLRAILSFGHTLGHAIEAEGDYSAYRHGEAIAIGMVAASLIAVGMKFEDWTDVEHERPVALLRKNGLPTRLTATASIQKLVDRTRVDKKAVSGSVRYVLPTRMGHVKLVKGVDDRLVVSALEQIGAR